jgi:hypothetical protein
LPLLSFFFFFLFSSFSFLFPKSNKLIRDYRDVNLNYPLEKLLMMASRWISFLSLELWILFSFSLFFLFIFYFFLRLAFVSAVVSALSSLSLWHSSRNDFPLRR